MPWKAAVQHRTACVYGSWEAHLQLHQQRHTRQPSQGYCNDHAEVSALFIHHLTPL